MEDEQIVALYWARDEEALRKTQEKYGRLLRRLAYGVLADREDSDESVNDACLAAWNSIPPHRPEALCAYLSKLTRRIAIDRLRARNSEKRRASEYALSLSELEECVSGGNTTEREADLHLLAEAVSAFLRTLSPQARGVFIRRYYLLESVRETARFYGFSETKVKSMLYRTRLALKTYLEQEGFSL